MAPKPIELILLRQLASRLPLPVALVDAQGVLVYFNPAGERLLAVDYAALGEYPISPFRRAPRPSPTGRVAHEGAGHAHRRGPS